MPEPTKKPVETKTARSGVDGKTSKKTQVVVSRPFMEILIGGPYTKKSGEEARYGHAALRVVVDKTDTTYDFGRYGKVWGKFDSEGEGILRVWSAFKPYIAGENATGRQTVGFVYPLKAEEAKKIKSHFATLLTTAANRSTKAQSHKVYRLAKDYHPTNHNCTTVTIDGAVATGKKIVHNPHPHSKRRGLTNAEGLAAKFEDWPWHKLFMPADLQAMLEANTECPYEKKNTYAAKR